MRYLVKVMTVFSRFQVIWETACFREQNLLDQENVSVIYVLDKSVTR